VAAYRRRGRQEQRLAGTVERYSRSQCHATFGEVTPTGTVAFTDGSTTIGMDKV
jgi:hypothetical protein